MAVDQRELIYTLGVTPGIKRDGTTFEAREFSDGEWCRFQRGIPKKVGGYRQMFREPNGVPRGLIMNAYNGVNYMFLGTKDTLDVFTTGTTLGLGSGPYTATTTIGIGAAAATSNLILTPGYFYNATAANQNFQSSINSITIGNARDSGAVTFSTAEVKPQSEFIVQAGSAQINVNANLTMASGKPLTFISTFQGTSSANANIQGSTTVITADKLNLLGTGGYGFSSGTNMIGSVAATGLYQDPSYSSSYNTNLPTSGSAMLSTALPIWIDVRSNRNLQSLAAVLLR